MRILSGAPPKKNTANSAKKPARPVYQPPVSHYDYAMDEREGFFAKHKILVIIFFCLIALSLVLCISLFVITKLSAPSSSQNTILNNVTAGGINLGGLTAEEAEAAINAELSQKYASTDMVVRIGNSEIILTPSVTGASVDAAALAEAAISYGHEGGTIEQAKAITRALSTQFEIDILPYLILNTDQIRYELDRQCAVFDSQFRQSSFWLEGNAPVLDISVFDPFAQCQTLVLDVGMPGYGVDTEALLSEILDAYSKGDFIVDAQTQLSPRTPDPLNLEAIHDAASIPATESSGGYSFDLQAAQEQLRTAEAGAIIQIPMVLSSPVKANVSSEFPDELASVETSHNQEVARNNNLQLACDTLNGIIIQPGETVSFNEMVGPRTNERGYLSATAFGNNSYAQPVGGGIDQVATALYNCALYADLDILERSATDFMPGYAEPGMDAAVSQNGQDLVIRNNTSDPIKITASCGPDSIQMQLLGTDRKDYVVKMEYQMTTFPVQSIYQEVAADSGISNGSIIEYGNDGYFVQTYRCKYRKGTNEQIANEPEAISNFPMNPNIYATVTNAG